MKSLQAIINQDFASLPATSTKPTLSPDTAVCCWRSIRILICFLILARTFPVEFLGSSQ